MSSAADTALASAGAASTDAPVVYEVHEATLADPNYKRLTQLNQSLKQWINSFISQDLLVVRDITSDLTIARAIALLLEQVTGDEILPQNAFTTSTLKTYTQLLPIVVSYVERTLGLAAPADGRWTLKGMLAQDIRSILAFLVDLAVVLQCPFAIPANVSVAVTQKQIINGTEKTKTTVHRVTAATDATDGMPLSPGTGTGTGSDIPAKPQDAFDELTSSPEKQQEFAGLLLEYINTALAAADITVRDLSDLDDGVHLIILVGVLADMFVPLCRYSLMPANESDKLANISLALLLMRDLGINTDRIEASDILAGNLTSICRC
ncbi:hypothetical protein BC831DRAFT_547279, partial [Entophlyctis helioformis]